MIIFTTPIISRENFLGNFLFRGNLHKTIFSLKLSEMIIGEAVDRLVLSSFFQKSLHELGSDSTAQVLIRDIYATKPSDRFTDVNEPSGPAFLPMYSATMMTSLSKSEG